MQSVTQTPTRRNFLRTLSASAGASLLPWGCNTQPASESASNRPNIVMIMSDDMGYSDLGCYGGEIETPNLDRLAKNGLRFTNYHTNNMCVPTRGSLMSGVYSIKSLKKGTLRADVVTPAEALKAAGYATYMTGKWHLSEVGDHANHPCQRGFDHYFGTLIGSGSFFAPAALMRDNENAENEFQDPDFYYTDAISDQAATYIDEAATKDQPFFLYVSYTAAHWPLHARESDIEKYKGRYAQGWDQLRLQRHQRMKQLGVINPDWPLSPRNPDVPAWDDEPHKEWQQRRMEVYAAQIDVMDQGIGRILAALERQGKIDNTLILFQVDNGGCHVEYTPDRKGNYLPEKTRDGRPLRVGNLPSIMPGPEDTFLSYGYGWANASNTPFRLYKQFDHEGGIMTPLIAHWPGVVAPGTFSNELAHVIDLPPTFLEAAGTETPREFNGKPMQPIDGKSLLAVLKGGEREDPETLFWQHAHGAAMRKGRWKLVRVDDNPWELYDIEADGTELNDLAKDLPDIAADLQAQWEAWAANTA